MYRAPAPKKNTAQLGWRDKSMKEPRNRSGDHLGLEEHKLAGFHDVFFCHSYNCRMILIGFLLGGSILISCSQLITDLSMYLRLVSCCFHIWEAINFMAQQILFRIYCILISVSIHSSSLDTNCDECDTWIFNLRSKAPRVAQITLRTEG